VVGGGDFVLKPDAQVEDVIVLLNYDVWSLACIMLEVLIFLLDASAPPCRRALSARGLGGRTGR
jgi:hypothetical protein